MSRIQSVFTGDHKVLVPFVTAGFPRPEVTVDIMHALVRAGADIIELGMPFSDPMADGPVIQAACEQAIAAGVDLSAVLDMVAEFRKDDARTPIVLMGYLNPIERMGAQQFAERAAAAGVDGALIVDAPLEENDSVEAITRAGIDRIFLVAPTTPTARFELICKVATGFIYYVSLTGITGAGHMSVASVETALQDLQSRSPLPLAVGFGIKHPADAAGLTQADAIVIGSALLASLDGADDPAAAAEAFLRPFRAALDAA